jgi:hypothetical protein
MSALTAVREVQLPMLAIMLLSACAAKLLRVLRARSPTAALGPAALFPLRLRRPLAVALCLIEFILGIALIVTAGRQGAGSAANVTRICVALLFIVATCALIELRTSKPDTGCGCFGDFSTEPVRIRTLARSILLAVAAAITVGLPPVTIPRPGTEVTALAIILAAELILIAALSPESGELLVRLGYSTPCELRQIPPQRSLESLRASAQWRRQRELITTTEPADMWRELCWRYIVFNGVSSGRAVDLVFAVYLRERHPVVHAAVVDSATGAVLSSSEVTKRLPERARRGARPGVPAGQAASARPAGSADPAPGAAAPADRSAIV